jgi:hypothetical protein
MTRENIAFSTLMNEYDLARSARVSVATVRRLRAKKLPKYLKIGASVRYRPEDIAAWLDGLTSDGDNQSVGNVKAGLGTKLDPEKEVASSLATVSVPKETL